MTKKPNFHPIELGAVIGPDRARYRLDAIEVQSQGAFVYHAIPLKTIKRGHYLMDKAGSTVFVVVLQKPLDPAIAHTLGRWQAAQKQMRRAMTQVDPSVAGFPEWNKIRQDDPVRLYQDEIGLVHWAAFQVTTYRRRLAEAMAESRRPHNFSASMRKALLAAAGGRCWRCESDQKLEADHILPIGLGGINGAVNGIILCSTCHLEKTRAERTAFGQSLGDAGGIGDIPHRKRN